MHLQPGPVLLYSEISPITCKELTPKGMGMEL